LWWYLRLFFALQRYEISSHNYLLVAFEKKCWYPTQDGLNEHLETVCNIIIMPYDRCFLNNYFQKVNWKINEPVIVHLRTNYLIYEVKPSYWYWLIMKLMKGKALRKHSLHEKTAASVLLKLFISEHMKYNHNSHSTAAVFEIFIRKNYKLWFNGGKRGWCANMITSFVACISISLNIDNKISF